MRLGTALAIALLSGGLTANAAANDPPELDSLSAAGVGYNWWIISGTVSDESVGSCIVEFGGVLAGRSASVNSDGTYQLVTYLPGGGVITAIAYDAVLNASEEAQTSAI